MKLQLMSDLHLEFGDMTLPGGDVLLLAGDICVADCFRAERTDRDAIRHRETCDMFFHNECSKYNTVYYIMGNHEHYGGVFDNNAAILCEYLAGTNVTLLEKQAVTVDDWTIFGGTMWTNYRNANPMSMNAAQCGMTDHEHIRKSAESSGYRAYRPQFYPNDALADHEQFMHELSKCVEDLALDMRKLIVMSHHAPSYNSVHEIYKGSLLNDAYASDLENIMISAPHIKYWFHGHMHDSMDYMVEGCRVVCNPRGYHGHYLNSEFNSNLVFELK